MTGPDVQAALWAVLEMLDHEYLNQWARRLGVREELDYLWSQSDRATAP
jgi:hypothetical protein